VKGIRKGKRQKQHRNGKKDEREKDEREKKEESNWFF
jgi:hypothetical protein